MLVCSEGAKIWKILIKETLIEEEIKEGISNPKSINLVGKIGG